MKKINSFTGEYRFLSNFYSIEIEYKGISYPSVEHFYQAMKSTNPEVHKKIASLPNPSLAKIYGKKIDLQENWNGKRIKIMRLGLKKKFKDSSLRKKLLATKNAELIEGNWWGDTFWGVCKGEGKNNLGKLLMETRRKCNEKT